MLGKVQSWSDSRGFGFVIDEKKRTVFVHWCEIAGEGFKTLKVGQKVEFDLYETDMGLEGKNVRKL